MATGVAAVEAVYAATILGHSVIRTVILPSIIVFEIAGVLMSDHALQRWRSWIVGEEEALRAAAGVDHQPYRIPRPGSTKAGSRRLLDDVLCWFSWLPPELCWVGADNLFLLIQECAKKSSNPL